VEVSPDLISRVTDAVLDEVKEWRARALDAVYPVVIFDALRVKIRDKDSRIVKNKAVYLASASPATASERSWACGSPRTRGRSSGSR
jgi:transposase-like protein